MEKIDFDLKEAFTFKNPEIYNQKITFGQICC